MEVLHGLIDAVRWLIGLAKPDNLKALVDGIGPAYVYGVIAAIVFSETGLLVGFFLPGDSLLFAAGFLASQDVFNIVLLNALLMVAAIVGDALNYFVGLQASEHVFEKGRLRFVRHSHLMAAKEFYDRHGGKAIILARFVPLVRTFTPFVAGVARMGYARFAAYNVVGGIGWVASMTLAGWFLGNIPLVKNNFEAVVLLIIFVSVLPVMIGGLKHWRQSRAALPEPIER
ncbi:MAG TPA: VTT domain-containing protein [Pirellulales bacterium]|nr:VTT domain-containing protein [Pirellulales bacterium]